MNTTEVLGRTIDLMDIVAPVVVAMETLSQDITRDIIFSRTESTYLHDKWDGDFSHRYLNSDDKNKQIWLDDFFKIDTGAKDIILVTIVMKFFYNNSMECFDFDYSRYKIDPFGNSKNWCTAWLVMSYKDHERLIKQIFNN